MAVIVLLVMFLYANIRKVHEGVVNLTHITAVLYIAEPCKPVPQVHAKRSERRNEDVDSKVELLPPD